MRGLPSGSIHAIVTDPPYFLMNESGSGFMGEDWESLNPSKIKNRLCASKEFAQLVERFFLLIKVGSSTAGGSSAPSNASEGNPARLNSNALSAGRESKDASLGLRASANSVRGIVLTREEASDMLSESLGDRTTVIESLPDDAKFAVPYSFIKRSLKNIVQENVLRLPIGEICSENGTLLTSTEEARINGAIEGMIGGVLGNEYIGGTTSSAEYAGSTAGDARYRRIISTPTNRQRIIRWIISLLYAINVTSRPKRELLQYTVYQFHKEWAREALRVLKPGASMFVMGGTRTYHRMTCAIEDVGFIAKDTILHCYNSGFPKAQDLGKLIDKRNGRKIEDFKRLGEYLKVQRESKGLSQKNIAEHFPSKTGGLTGCVWNWESGMNVPTNEQWELLKGLLNLNDEFDWLIKREEAERKVIGQEEHDVPKLMGLPNVYDGQRVILDITTPATPLAREWDGYKIGGIKPSYEPVLWSIKPPEGSTTENVLKHGVGAIHIDACRIPRSSDDRFEYGVNGDEPSTPGKTCYGDWGRHTYEPASGGRYPANMVRTDRFEDGYDRFYFIPKADRVERDRGLEGMPTKDVPYSEYRENFADTESWVSKYPDGKSRPMNKIRNTHPTVKPVRLMEYLIKLVTRQDQIVLDPFVGSGTTCIAARNLLRRSIGFDNNAEYCKIARKRLAAIPPPLEAFA